MRLKLFSDKQYLSANAPLVPILYPFWGIPSIEDSTHVWLKTITFPALGNFMQVADLHFEMVPIEEADIVVLPNDLSFFDREVKHHSIQLIELAKNLQKRVVGFFSGDLSHLQLPLDMDISFRDSLYRFNRQQNEFLMPTWIEDLTKINGESDLKVRQKGERPVIGFCGYAAPKNLKAYVKTTLYRWRKVLPKQKGTMPPYYTPPHYTGHVIRSLALAKLEKSSLIETNFILRQQAGLLGKDSNEAKAYRDVYVENLVDSDYVLCCRGSGNHSNRLYETLCCGRIPVFIDTDCVLPLDFDVNWKDYCVYINEDEISQIDQKISEFHKNLSPLEFIEFQHKCRRLWEEKISPEGFFSNFYRHFEILDGALESEST
jgi:hypothetical protein